MAEADIGDRCEQPQGDGDGERGRCAASRRELAEPEHECSRHDGEYLDPERHPQGQERCGEPGECGEGARKEARSVVRESETGGAGQGARGEERDAPGGGLIHHVVGRAVEDRLLVASEFAQSHGAGRRLDMDLWSVQVREQEHDVPLPVQGVVHHLPLLVLPSSAEGRRLQHPGEQDEHHAEGEGVGGAQDCQDRTGRVAGGVEPDQEPDPVAATDDQPERLGPCAAASLLLAP